MEKQILTSSIFEHIFVIKFARCVLESRKGTYGKLFCEYQYVLFRALPTFTTLILK